MRELIDYWLDLRSASRAHLAVRLVTFGGAALVTLALVLAGAGTWVLWAGTLLLGALVLYQPTTLMPLVFLLFAVGAWWAGVEGPWHWALLPAALGLLVVHAGSALASSVPPQAPIPRSVLELWALRTGVVAGLVALTWAVAGLLAGVSSTTGGAVPGIIGLAALTAGLGAYARVRARTTTRV